MTENVFYKLMKHFELTTRTLGAKVGLSRTAISEIARGRLPRVDDAIRIARQLDVTVEELWPTKDVRRAKRIKISTFPQKNS